MSLINVGVSPNDGLGDDFRTAAIAINAANHDSVVVVKTSADFGAVDSTKVYFIDGIIDMTGVSVEIPAGGINIHGSTFDISQLICTDNSYTMFTSAVGGCGNILIHDVSFEVSGTGSQIFDVTSLTGFEAFESTAVNFNNCTS